MKRILHLLTAFIALSFATQSYAQGCLPGWQYQTPIDFYSSDTTQLNDYQVNIIVNTQALVTSGKLNPDGSDLRFIDACCNNVCFWIESGINTATTSIWVNVPQIPASGASTLYMVYGNVAGTDASDASCTFDLFEGFDTDLGSFSQACGATTATATAGNLDLSWASSGELTSSSIFPLANTYRLEANVNTATGSWPAIYWYKVSDNKNYGLMIDASQARISVVGGGTDYCSGHNWASGLVTYSGVAGIWSHTWVSTGNIQADFPTIGAMSTTDALYAKDSDLRVGIGGISSGSGTMNVDWIRVRKYNDSEPFTVVGTEAPLSGFSSSIVDIPYSDTLFCAGGSVLIDAGNGFSTQVWSTGDTTQVISVNSPGQYYVDVVDPGGCSSSDTVNIVEMPLPVIDLGADTTLCSGDTLSIDAGPGYSSYQWSTSSTNQIIGVTASGSYYVWATDSNGCVGADTISAIFSVVSAGFTASSTNLDATFTDGSTGAISYDWDFGDGTPNSSAVNPTHTYATTGTYTVCLTVVNTDGCSNTYCEDVVINNVGVNEMGGDNFGVYPTPATDILTVESVSVEDCSYEIVDLAGKTISQGTIKNGKNEINIEKMLSGVYVIRIAQEGTMFSQRIVIE